jgi:hypothetical protein
LQIQNIRRSALHILVVASALPAIWCGPQARSAAAGREVEQGLNSKLTLSARQVSANGGLVRLTLTNTGTKSIELQRSDLPIFQRTLLAVGVDASTDEPLIKRFLLETAPPGRIQIPAGAAVTEDLDLSNWFPSLSAVLRANDVVVLWRYKLMSTHPGEGVLIYGGITLRHE